MVNFYVYSFSIAAIPLLLGVLLIWFGKKLWKKANAENAKYQQRYTGRTTLRVIGVEKHMRLVAQRLLEEVVVQIPDIRVHV